MKLLCPIYKRKTRNEFEHSAWHEWFAWRPIRGKDILNNQPTWFWLETINRRKEILISVEIGPRYKWLYENIVKGRNA